MVRGTWYVVRGAWYVVHGTWYVVRGAWYVVRGTWYMVRGKWCVVHGAWYVVHGTWCVVRGTWYMVRGTWYVVRGAWYVVHGTWYMVRGAWYVVHGTWYVVHGTWCMVRGAWYMVHGAIIAEIVIHEKKFENGNPRKLCAWNIWRYTVSTSYNVSFSETQQQAEEIALAVQVTYDPVGKPLITIAEAIAADSFFPNPGADVLRVGDAKGQLVWFTRCKPSNGKLSKE